jgi:predicted N-acyltransferase
VTYPAAPDAGEPELELTVEVADGVDAVCAADWNRLAGTGNPFVRHEFLAALERNDCVSETAGWLPQHLLMRAEGRLVGAVPLYAKQHSYGEFVFDWSWADAAERAGMAYYPKLVACAPFTPAQGPRLLCEGDAATGPLGDALAHAAREVAQRARVSSLHWLFPEPEQARALEASGFLLRTGYQFHWTNPGYRDFQDYLDSLTSKRRKQVRRERREAAAAPVTVEVLRGHEIDDARWEAYHGLYASTYDRKWGMPSLTPGFFREVGATLPDSVMLVLARHGDRYVAGAHLFAGSDALYGRNWGCSEFHRSLHFEMCYYRPMEFCIEHGLGRFEAGAQGEHKLTRGFLPVHTYSAHWLRHDEFRAAVARFLASERREIDAYIEAAGSHSPFREEPEPPAAALDGI